MELGDAGPRPAGLCAGRGGALPSTPAGLGWAGGGCWSPAGSRRARASRGRGTSSLLHPEAIRRTAKFRVSSQRIPFPAVPRSRPAQARPCPLCRCRSPVMVWLPQGRRLAVLDGLFSPEGRRRGFWLDRAVERAGGEERRPRAVGRLTPLSGSF